MPRSKRYRELIELELTSLIQKLAYLRGNGMSPRSFPVDERDAIEAFGVSCCRMAADDIEYEPNPFDKEDTSPGWKKKRGNE